MILNFCAQTRRKLQMFIILYFNLKMRIGEEECIVLKISRLRLSREIFQPITVEITFFSYKNTLHHFISSRYNQEQQGINRRVMP